MTLRHKSLVQSLLGSLLVPGLAVMVIGVLIVQHIFKDEYDELLDASLIGKAHLLVEFIERPKATRALTWAACWILKANCVSRMNAR